MEKSPLTVEEAIASLTHSQRLDLFESMLGMPKGTAQVGFETLGKLLVAMLKGANNA